MSNRTVASVALMVAYNRLLNDGTGLGLTTHEAFEILDVLEEMIAGGNQDDLVDVAFAMLTGKLEAKSGRPWPPAG